MSVFGKGECLYGLMKVCRLGDEGIQVNPIFCLNCAIIYLAETLREVTLPSEDSEEITEEHLH